MTDHDTMKTDSIDTGIIEELSAVARLFPAADITPVLLRKRLTSYRDIFKRRMDGIEASYDDHHSGIETANAITLLVDCYIAHAFSLYVARENMSPACAVVALGGYGRSELNPFSDVDILCLVAEDSTGVYDAGIRDMLQFLWDMNFDLGHSTRTSSECFRAAATDQTFATALLDARFITGDESIWSAHREYCEKWKHGETGQLLISGKIEERAQRLDSFHNTVQIQEPNVKECPGGLRDIHVARWLVGLVGKNDVWHGFVDEDFLTAKETELLHEDLDFFLKVRHALHFHNGKRSDLLDHIVLPDTARKAGYDGEGLAPAERLMHDYYMRAGRVRRLTDRIVHKILAALSPDNSMTVTRTRDGILVGDRAVSLPGDRRAKLADNPETIVTLFITAGTRDLPIDADTERAVEEAIEETRVDFTGHEGVRQSFNRLFERRTGVAATLRLMHEYGILSKLVPEFDDISFHYQYDYYHTYTTDEHSIRVVENLERMASGKRLTVPELHDMMQDVPARGALYLAGLLHDIGKKGGRGHAERGEIMAVHALKRLKCDRRTVELVRFLIREHLLMSHISQRRDIDDEETVADFAGRVGSAGRLRMLTLLTFADLLALSENALTEWKKALLRGLYKKALVFIEKGYEEHDGIVRHDDLERAVGALSGGMPEAKVLAHLTMLPDQYLRVTATPAIKAHIKGIDRMKKTGVWTSFRRSGDITLLTVISRDHPKILSDICGSITSSGINIIGARIFTRDDGVIIDTFLVANTDGTGSIPLEAQKDFKENIRRVIAKETEATALIENYRRRWRRRKKNVVFSPPRIRVHNDVSSRYTVLDVFAIDYTGLLYDITSELASLGMDIHTARIGTDEDQVADAFYIQGPGGGKIEDEQAIEGLRTAIIERLNAAYV